MTIARSRQGCPLMNILLLIAIATAVVASLALGDV
jgi:hypothetical protein